MPRKFDLKARLANKLNQTELDMLYKSYDVIGDIAIIKVPEPLTEKCLLIAEAIMEANKHVKTVLRQVTPVSGIMRLRGLEWVCGERKTETIHKESGCLFMVDLERCYFSPRLQYERMRIARLVKGGEVIINMFAGVGCFSIIIAKHSDAKKIYSIDINPNAIQYMVKNIRLNGVEGVVEPIEGDAKEVILNKLRNIADRVLMPLPEKAYEYLQYAIEAIKESGWIHYYGFEYASKNENPIEKIKYKVSKKLAKLNIRFNIPHGRIVRTVGPRWYQIVLDIKVNKEG